MSEPDVIELAERENIPVEGRSRAEIMADLEQASFPGDAMAATGETADLLLRAIPAGDPEKRKK